MRRIQHINILYCHLLWHLSSKLNISPSYKNLQTWTYNTLENEYILLRIVHQTNRRGAIISCCISHYVKKYNFHGKNFTQQNNDRLQNKMGQKKLKVYVQKSKELSSDVAPYTIGLW